MEILRSADFAQNDRPLYWITPPNHRLTASRSILHPKAMKTSPRLIPFILVTCTLVVLFRAAPARADDYDIVVYGGTSAGVIAAVQAKKMGKSVVIVSPDKHLGGLSSGGLGFTDTGNKAVIGGLAREFYHRVWQHYNQPDAWKWQKREEYGNKGQGTPAIDGEQRT